MDMNTRNRPVPRATRPPALGRRIRREKRTIAVMMSIYCRDHHGGRGEPCADCSEVLKYADRRLDHCPFGDSKYACVNCRIHCYSPVMAERTKAVMRYAGPRMLWRHPLLGLLHLFDRYRHP